jgi:hypothetical protein
MHLVSIREWSESRDGDIDIFRICAQLFEVAEICHDAPNFLESSGSVDGVALSRFIDPGVLRLSYLLPVVNSECGVELRPTKT